MEVGNAFFGDRDVYLFGAGAVGKNLFQFLSSRRWPVKAFLDSNRALHGKIVLGVPVLDPAEFLSNPPKNSFVIITAASPYDAEIELLCRKSGLVEGTDYLPYYPLLESVLVFLHKASASSRKDADDGAPYKKLKRLLQEFTDEVSGKLEQQHTTIKNNRNVLQIKEVHNKNKKKAYILNDTATRAPEHLGCLTVMRNLKTVTEKFGMAPKFFDGSNPNIDFDHDDFVAHMSECDVLILNGEGTLHDDAGIGYLKRCQIAKELHKKTILVNTIWENNSVLNDFLDCFDLISARESLSYASLIEGGAPRERVFIIPDLFFYDSTFFDSIAIRRDIQLCFLDCSVRTHTRRLEEIAKTFSAPFYTMANDYILALENKLQGLPPLGGLAANNFRLLSAPYVVSGRFHATCFCLATGIPVLSVAANTYKTEGMLHDAGIPFEKYFIKNINNLTEERILSFMELDHTEYIEISNCYVKSTTKKIDAFFERINDI